jgi:fibronectin type 3 domain-containing protein
MPIQPPPNRIYGFLKSFPKGVNSDVDPLLLEPEQLSFAQNATVRGDFVHQRPPFLNLPLVFQSAQTQLDFNTGIFQGACYFLPDSGEACIMVAVGGNLFQLTVENGSCYVEEIILGTNIVSAPSAPTGLTATAQDNAVLITWTAPANANSYNILRNTTGSATTYTTIATAASGTGYVDGTALNGTAYYYAVQAVNGGGTSGDSGQVTATPFAPTTAPATPTGLAATASSGQIVLAWNSVSGAYFYSVFRGVTSGGESATALASGLTTPNYTDNSVSNGITYYYTVSAINFVGTSGKSSEVSASPLSAPAAPTGVYAYGFTAWALLLCSAVPAATSYNLYQVSGGVYTKLASGLTAPSFAGNSVLTYNATALTNGTTYSYAWTAVNANGESAYSATISATPTASIPAIPSNAAMTVSATGITISWTPVAATGYLVAFGGSPIVYLPPAATSSTGQYSLSFNAVSGTTYYGTVRAVNLTTGAISSVPALSGHY